MTTDSMWQVDLPEWPTFDIDRDQLLAVLDEFEQFWPVAVASLAHTQPSDQRQGEHE